MTENETDDTADYEPVFDEDIPDEDVEETAADEDGPEQQPEAEDGMQDMPTDATGPLAFMDSAEPELSPAAEEA